MDKDATLGAVRRLGYIRQNLLSRDMTLLGQESI